MFSEEFSKFEMSLSCDNSRINVSRQKRVENFQIWVYKAIFSTKFITRFKFTNDTVEFLNALGGIFET